MASFKNLISNTSAQISSGGTITGDLVINGDLQVDGGGSLSFDEIIEGTQVIDVTNTEALLVRKNGDGGDVMVVDTTNSRVGIGVTPTGKLDINISSNARGYFASNIGEVGSGNFALQVVDSGGSTLKPLGFRADDIRFATGSAERMRLTDTGLGIGTDSPTQLLHIASSTDAFIQLERVDTSVANNDAIGAILFRGGESSIADIGRIRLHADADFTSSSSPTKMIFETTPSGSTVDAVALTLGSDQSATFAGDIFISNSTPLLRLDDSDVSTNVSLDGSGGIVKLASHTGQSVRFLIGSTEVSRFNSSGKLGLGTVSPSGKLTLSNGSASAPLSITASNAYIQLGSEDFGSGGLGKFMIGFGYTDVLTNTNAPAYIGFEETSTSGDTKGNLTFYTRNVTTDTLPTQRMVISDDGNVGIGSDTSSKLTVVTTSDTDGTPTAYSNKFFTVGEGGTTGGNVFISYDQTNNRGYIGALTPGTAWRNLILNAGGGDVGINEVSPDKKLHISSSTSADGIVIENTSTGATQIRFEADSSALRGLIGVDDSDGGAFLSSTASKAYVMCLRSEGEIHFGVNGNNTRFILDNNSRISLSNNDSGTANTVFGRTAGDAIASGGNNNTLFGFNAGSSITTGDGNVLLGYRAGETFDTNGSNVGIGSQALGGNGNASNCVAIGTTTLSGSLSSASDGTVAVGHNALSALTSGEKNVAIGYQASLSLLQGNRNTAIGYQALDALAGDDGNNGGSDNIAIGVDAMGSLNAGVHNDARANSNIAIGNSAFLAGSMADTGASVSQGNVAIGHEAIMSTGVTPHVGTTAVGFRALKNLTSGSGNLAVGYLSLTTNGTGSYNTAVGYEALTSLPDGGSQNTAIGWKALHGATSSACDNLTAIGYKAGFQISTGFNNTLIGANVDVNTGNFDNVTAIGNNFEATSSDSVFLGNANVTDVYMAVDSGATVHCAGVNLSGGILTFSADTELTISSGAVTATRNYHTLDTEGGAGTDDLDTINGGSDGQLLILRDDADGRDVTAKDGTGNLALEGDFTFTNSLDTLTLLYCAGKSKWLEISRSNNA